MSVHQHSTGRSSSAHAHRHRGWRGAGAAAALACEQLEARSLMSVSLGADGYTDITPSSDSRIVYVSSSAGSDSNSGLSHNAPVKTIAKGMSLVRDNAPDHLLLKRGDEWTETIKSWSKSGRSASEPIVFGNYGDLRDDRPLLKAGGSTAFETSGSVDHLAVVGIHLWANKREAGASGFTNVDNFGMRLVASTKGMLVEDCVIDQFGDNIYLSGYYGDQSNFKLRRSVLTDAWSPRYKAQGFYASDVSGLLLEENVFDHNGWNEDVADGGASSMSHNAYIASTNDNVVVRGNIFADAASHGLQARAGGEITNNLFLRNPIHMSFGIVNGQTIKPGGVTGTVSGNVMIDSRKMGDSTRGWAIELGNIKAATVRDNVISSDGGKGGSAAISLGYGGSVPNTSEGVGINNLVIEDNVVRKWQQGMTLAGNLRPGGSGYTSLNNLTVRDNDFQFVYWEYHRVVEHSMPLNRGEEFWSNNRYYEDATQNDWFMLNGSRSSFSKWKADVEPTAKAEQVSYSSPDRTIATYQQSIGGTASLDGFMSGARDQAEGSWRSNFTAQQVINYVRAGFDRAPVSGSAGGGDAPAPAPTPQALVLSASTLSVPEGGSAAFDVKLAAQPAADVQVAVAALAGGDGDLSTATGTLTFTPGNWNSAQAVGVAAAEDADQVHGPATFTVSSAGLATKSVAAAELDNDAPVPAEPVTLRAAADAYVRDGSTYGGTNFGTATQVQLKQGAVGWNREALLRFDLSSVPTAGAAKLRLYGKLDNTSSSEVGFAVYDAADTVWSETATTWNNRPAAGSASHGTGTVRGTSGNWYDVDVTGAVAAARAAGRTAVTLVLRAASASGSTIVFDSDEATNRPQLVVTPGAGEPEPSAPAVVVSKTSLAVPEGGAATFEVKLASQPAEPVTVTVAETAGGDGDLSTLVSTLTFTPTDWDVAKPVAVTAAEDADASNGTASFTVASADASTHAVAATESDNDVISTPTVPTTLTANADTYVRDGSTYGGSNFGTDGQLQVKQGNVGWNRESVLRFDLSSVSSINSAKLRLFGMLDNVETPSVGFRVLSSSNTTWSETATTWNNRPAATTIHGTGTVTGRTGRWYEVDLTSFLRAEKAAGRNVVTLVVQAAAPSPATILFDSVQRTNRPQLLIA